MPSQKSISTILSGAASPKETSTTTKLTSKGTETTTITTQSTTVFRSTITTIKSLSTPSNPSSSSWKEREVVEAPRQKLLKALPAAPSSPQMPGKCHIHHAPSKHKQIEAIPAATEDHQHCTPTEPTPPLFKQRPIVGPAQYLLFRPLEPPCHTHGPSLYLTDLNTSEQGAAVSGWDDEFIRRLHDVPCTIYNPQRAQWPPGGLSRTDREAMRALQAKWERDRETDADVIAVMFAPGTQDSSALLELGGFLRTHARDGKRRLVVCCPRGWWCYSEVEVACKKHDIPIVDRFDELVECVKQRFAGIRKDKRKK